MSRLIPKKRDELGVEEQEQYDRIARFREPRPEGGFGGPFDPWLRSPELARRNIAMGSFVSVPRIFPTVAPAAGRSDSRMVARSS